MDVREAEAELKKRCEEHFAGVERPRRCEKCGHRRVWWNGVRLRCVTMVVWGVLVYLAGIACRRVKCASCKVSWVLRPPGIIAHKQYQADVVALAMAEYLLARRSQDQVAARVGCSRRTVGRWIGWTAEIAEPDVLAAELVRATEEPVLPRVQGVPGIAWDESMRPRLERAREVLGLMEALASAWGLAAPGLAGVVERVLRGRSGVATYRSPLIPEFARGPPR